MTTKLNKDQIRELLPHREPMLLIDELVNIKKLHSAKAIINVTKDIWSLIKLRYLVKMVSHILKVS